MILEDLCIFLIIYEMKRMWNLMKYLKLQLPDMILVMNVEVKLNDFIIMQRDERGYGHLIMKRGVA
jgi:hypothetical protein